ncbi:MAG: DUF4440 domain-containing protein [Flavobacteriaceae bacterium]|nr:MAG: DUF4440 domain-containing protein [Flavobacteriaceae bacterium]
MKSKLVLACLIFVGSTIAIHQIHAQKQDPTPPSKNLSQTILELDSSFWESYNTCNIEGFQKFLTQDVEFYHDKGGLTVSRTALMEAINTGLCSDNGPKMRRVAKEGTIAVYPIANYGAIITGEHLFYQKNGDKKERLVEKAKFTHIWQHKDNTWKMSRVLSYDHQAISENSSKKEVQLTTETLQEFTGTYRISDNKTINVSIEGKTLKIKGNNHIMIVYPESITLFYHKEAPLEFEFIKDDMGLVHKFTIRENGTVVDEAIRIK